MLKFHECESSLNLNFNHQKLELNASPANIFTYHNLLNNVAVNIGDGHPSMNGWRIYTDGSKSDRGVGCAYAVFKDKALIDFKLFALSSNCSAFQAEVFAILKASEYVCCVSDCLEETSFNIISDNQSAIKAIANPKSKQSLILDARLKILSSPVPLSLTWVKAHQLDYFNDYVDNLAKRASLLPTVSFDRCPLSWMRNEITKVIWHKFLSNYASKTSSYYSDKFFPWPSTVQIIHNSDIDPKIIHFITNKGNFSQHLFQIKRKLSPLCSSCLQQEGSSEHVIFSCPKVNQARLNLISKLQQFSIVWPVDLPTLVSKQFINFFKEFINVTGYSVKPGIIIF